MLQQIYKRSWLSIPILQLLSTKEGFWREESSKSCAWFTYADNKATSNKYSWICRVMTWLILHQCDTRDHLRVGFPAQFLPASNLQCKDLVALDLEFSGLFLDTKLQRSALTFEDYLAKCAESSSARIIIYIYIYIDFGETSKWWSGGGAGFSTSPCWLVFSAFLLQACQSF